MTTTPPQTSPAPNAASPGQHVLVVPELPNGALQEAITVPASQLYPAPDEMPAAVAAALHIAYQTAYVGLHHRAALLAGDALLVTGAAGGVGTAAVQLGRAAGAFVIAAVTGPRKAEACRRMGGDLVIDLAGDADPAGRVRAATGGSSSRAVSLGDRHGRCRSSSSLRRLSASSTKDTTPSSRADNGSGISDDLAGPPEIPAALCEHA